MKTLSSYGSDGLRAGDLGSDGLRAGDLGSDGLRAGDLGSDGLRAGAVTGEALVVLSRSFHGSLRLCSHNGRYKGFPP